jgi:hypothetical protein
MLPDLPMTMMLHAAASSALDLLTRDPLSTISHGWRTLAAALAACAPYLIAVCVAVVIMAAGGRAGLCRWQRARLAEGARLIAVQVPPQVDPGSAEAFWANMTGLLRPRWRRLLHGQPHVAFEYVWTGQTLRLQLWVPGQIPDGMIEHAVEAAWPASRTTTATATRGAADNIADQGAPFPAAAVVSAGQLRLARPDHYPLRCDFDSDPLRAMFGAGRGLTAGQYAFVQVLARPVTGRRLGRAHRAAASLRGAASPTWVSRLLDLLTPAPARRPARPALVMAAHPERAAEIRAIVDKAASPRFEVLVRYATATRYTANSEDDDATKAWLRGRAHALASAFAVYSGRNHFDRRRLRRPHDKLAGRWFVRGDLMSVAELAALAHLPYDPAVPELARAGANTVPPSPLVPTQGKVLGDTDAGASRPVAVDVADARHHLHVIGATGAGKSTLLANSVLGDLAAGRSVVVIDPRGDLIDDLLARLPARALDRVLLIDPDTNPPPALGVLAGGDPEVSTDNLVGIFHRIFADSWGPRTDDILRSACLTLTRAPAATLADIPRLLTDDAYQARLTARIGHTDGSDAGGGRGGDSGGDILVTFWAWYTALSREARAHAIGPVMNKLRHFLLRGFVRAVVGTPGPGIDMAGVLDQGGALLVRVPKGILGDDTARLLGSFVVAKVWETITHRARHSETERPDSALYVDEAHNFLNLPHGLEEMLAEARAYRLSLVLAHQNLAQLPRDMREAASANARTKIIFAVSPEDARDLARHTLPNLTAHDLTNLGAYTAAGRLIVAGQETPAFTFTTWPLPPAIPGRAQAARQAARTRAEATRVRPDLPDPRRAAAAGPIPGGVPDGETPPPPTTPPPARRPHKDCPTA